MKAGERMTDVLVVYYSFSGTTRGLAEEIAKQTAGELRELIPQKPYSFGHNTASKEVRGEIARGVCPLLSSGNEPADGYTTIFVGTPNWFKSLAPPVLSFLRGRDLSGKTIVPFCTHGGGGFGEIEGRIAGECTDSTLLPGLAAGSATTPEQVVGWLETIGMQHFQG